MGEANIADAERAGRGRPLSPALHRAVIDATQELLERESVGALSITGIAKTSGVSRPAIYRRWTNPLEIALDAFLEMTESQVTPRSDQPADAALVAQIKGMVGFLSSRGGQIAAELIGEGQSDPTLLEHFRTRFLASRRDEAKTIIERGIKEGTLRPDVDVELAVDLYAGPIYYRLMVRHAPLDAAFAKHLARSVLRALAVG